VFPHSAISSSSGMSLQVFDTSISRTICHRIFMNQITHIIHNQIETYDSYRFEIKLHPGLLWTTGVYVSAYNGCRLILLLFSSSSSDRDKCWFFGPSRSTCMVVWCYLVIFSRQHTQRRRVLPRSPRLL
jgi:hypothetical protein